jgi:hypothetical protein
MANSFLNTLYTSNYMQGYQQGKDKQAAEEQTAAEDEAIEETVTEVTGPDPNENNNILPGSPEAYSRAMSLADMNGDYQQQFRDLNTKMDSLYELFITQSMMDDGETGSEPGGNWDYGDVSGVRTGGPSGSAPASGSAPVGSTGYKVPVTTSGKGGTAAMRNNNPGNIKYGDFAAGYGATKGSAATDGGDFALFPTVEAGLQAQKALLRGKGYRDLDVTSAMKRWSNNGTYSERIGKAFGNKRMGDLTDTELDELVRLQIQGEDANMYQTIYGSMKQSGGSVPVLTHPEDKYEGLNNPSLGNNAVISNNGYNMYRGTDDGRPVQLQDVIGSDYTLFGPNDTAWLYGDVYEQRMPGMGQNDTGDAPMDYGAYLDNKLGALLTGSKRTDRYLDEQAAAYSKRNIRNTLKKRNLPYDDNAINFISAVHGKETTFGTNPLSKIQDYLPLFKSVGDYQINKDHFDPQYLPKEYKPYDFEDQTEAVYNFYNKHQGKMSPEQMYGFYNTGSPKKLSPYNSEFKRLYNLVTNLPE